MPAWVSSDPTWEKAKKAAKKQYPKLKGDKFWAIVATIYKQMGGKVKKSLILKAMPQGGAHPTHKYLRREGEPGDWHYIYEDETSQDEQTVPQSMGQAEGGNKISANSQESPASTRGSSGASQPTGSKPVMLATSILRDARPEDLQKPQIILWTVTTEQGIESMRHVGKFVGTHQSGGTHFSANRQAALNMAKEQPVLMAARVETKALRPIAPAKDIQSSLFPDDPAGSQALYPDTVNGNTVIGIIRPGDPLWPKGEDDEMSRVQDETNENSG